MTNKNKQVPQSFKIHLYGTSVEERASEGLFGDKRENVYTVPHITTTTTITTSVNKTKQKQTQNLFKHGGE